MSVWQRLYTGTIETIVAGINERMGIVDYVRDQQKPRLAFVFYVDNPPISQNDVAMVHGPGTVTDIVIPRCAFITEIGIQSNAVVTAGTLTAFPTINGTQLSAGVTLDSSNQRAKTEYERVAANFVNGVDLDRVGVEYDTDGSWAPTTADIQVTLVLELTCAD